MKKEYKATLKKWHIERANLLHRICMGIAMDTANDVAHMKVYRSALYAFNHSELARKRHLKLGSSTLRGYYAAWKKNPSPTAFNRKVNKHDYHKISAEECYQFGRRALEGNHSISEFYEILKKEIPDLSFSFATLCRNLPVDAIKAVHKAEKHLQLMRMMALDELNKMRSARLGMTAIEPEPNQVEERKTDEA